MMKVPFYQVDAFTSEPFRGNPAAVCLMRCDLEDQIYRSIAKEMNLSETAFVEASEKQGSYRLRWFTPKREVPLCGHATLATAHVLFRHRRVGGKRLAFETLGGVIYAERLRGGVRLDFPRNDPEEVEPVGAILRGLGVAEHVDFQYSPTNQKLLVRLQDDGEVRRLRPRFSDLLEAENTLGWRGVIVTAKGDEPYDFVSRYFAPWMGVDEDPVTGSAHTVLAPYWAAVLGKKVFRAYQASERGGELLLELSGDRVLMTGEAVTVASGTLTF
jgi:PhzF family phenazine biosynthesis protein